MVTDRKKKILFVGEHLTPSHVMRPLLLAAHLAETRPDLDVHFASPAPRPQSIPPSTPLTFHTLESPPSKILARRIERVFFPLYTHSEIQTMVDAEVALLSSLSPDLVVHDFRNTLTLSTQISKTPLVVLADFYWHRSYVPAPVVPDNPLSSLMSDTLLRTVAGALTPRVEALHLMPFNRYARSHNLRTFTTLRDLYSTGIANWLYDIPSVVPFAESPDTPCLGPVLWNRSAPIPDWLSSIETGSAICVTFSSNGDPTLIPGIIKALTPLSRPIIVLTAGRVRIEERPGLFVTDFMPMAQVLERASVLICPGGSTLAYHGLQAGTPIIGIPSNITHWYAMRRFEELGCGTLVSKSMLSESHLRTTTQTLIDRHRSESHRHTLMKELKDHDPFNNIGNLIDRALS